MLIKFNVKNLCLSAQTKNNNYFLYFILNLNLKFSSYNNNLRQRVEEGNLVDISDGDFEDSDWHFNKFNKRYKFNFYCITELIKFESKGQIWLLFCIRKYSSL